MATSEQKIIPLQIYGEPFFIDVPAVNTTPGTPQTLVSHTIADINKQIHQLKVISATMGKFEILIGSTVIGSGILGAGQNNETFFWTPPRPILIGQVLQLKYDALSDRPIDKVEAYIMLSTIEL